MCVDSGVVATISYFLWEHIGELFSQRRKSIAQVFQIKTQACLLLICCSTENERGEEELTVNLVRKHSWRVQFDTELREDKSKKQENRTYHIMRENHSFGKLLQ